MSNGLKLNRPQRVGRRVVSPASLRPFIDATVHHSVNGRNLVSEGGTTMDTESVEYNIRLATREDEEILLEMLMHAAHETSISRVRSISSLYRYARDWGRRGDLGFVAVDPQQPNKVLGAVWVRLWPDDDPGFGHVAEDIPELAIAVKPIYQRKGIGSDLMKHLLDTAKVSFRAVSLRVRDNNPAKKLYDKHGFSKVEGTETSNRTGGSSYIMANLLELKSEEPTTIRNATKEDTTIILNFIQGKLLFDRNISGFSGELAVNAQKLEDTLFGEVPFAYVLIAAQRDIPVAYALYAFRYSSFAGQPSLWLDDLFVDASTRGKGVGTLLMSFLARIADDKNCTHLGWNVDARNTKGVAFFHRLGAGIVEKNDYSCVHEWKPPLL